MGWDFAMRNDNTAGGDKRLFADLGILKNRRIHADDGAPLDYASFHNRAMADGAVFFDDRGRFA